MLQQILALILIAYFLIKLFDQKKKGLISSAEFIFWLVFWAIAVLAILFIKSIDNFVSGLGFSGSGIDILLYFGIFLLFYMIFRLRLKFERLERDLTKIIREIAINKNK